jgi:hypothetical protein
MMQSVDAHELVKLLKGLDWLDAAGQNAVLWFLDMIAREQIVITPDTARMLVTELERRGRPD